MAGSSAATCLPRIAVLDVETTGLDIKTDRIIQLACLVMNEVGKPIKLYESYINPGEGGLSKVMKTHKIHKITPERLRGEPCFEENAEEIIVLLRDVDIVAGHNVVYDWSMLREEFAHLDHKLEGEETDESWNEENRPKTNSAGYWLRRFDSLTYKILDTYRMAVVAYQNVPSHSLTALSSMFPVHVKKCQTVTYKWRTVNDFEENTLVVQGKREALREHNAVTDVFLALQLLTNCLQTLKIKFNDILKFPEYFCNISTFIEADRLLNKNEIPTDSELLQLAKMSPDHMNINHPDKGNQLKNMTEYNLQKVIAFLSSRKLYSDKRTALICRGFKIMLSDGLRKENSNRVRDESVFSELRFDKEVSDSSPIKADLRRINLSDTNPGKLVGNIDETKCSPAKIKKTEHFELCSAPGYENKEGCKEETKAAKRKMLFGEVGSSEDWVDSRLVSWTAKTGQLDSLDALTEDLFSDGDDDFVAEVTQESDTGLIAICGSSEEYHSESILEVDNKITVHQTEEQSQVYPVVNIAKKDLTRTPEKRRESDSTLILSPVF